MTSKSFKASKLQRQKQSHWIPAFAGMTSKNNGNVEKWMTSFAVVKRLTGFAVVKHFSLRWDDNRQQKQKRRPKAAFT